MYQIFGYQGQSEVSYKINQSQKDKLINIILNDNGTLRDKDEYEAMLDKLSFDERLSLVKPLNTLYTDAGNLVKASPELKENEQYFSASISYELSLKALTEDLKLRKTLRAFCGVARNFLLNVIKTLSIWGKRILARAYI